MFNLIDVRDSQQRDIQPKPRANNSSNNAKFAANNNIDNIKIGGGNKNYNTSKL